MMCAYCTAEIHNLAIQLWQTPRWRFIRRYKLNRQINKYLSIPA